MVNNFEIINNLLTFESSDDFYHLQILQRKKEHEELGRNSYVVRTYCIREGQLMDKKDEIIKLCDLFGARAYINLNVRSFESLAFQTLKKVTDQIMNKDFKSVKTAFESVCGMYGTGRNSSWIIDIDGDTDDELLFAIELHVNGCRPYGENKIIAKIPTKNGIHIITKPFDKENVTAKQTLAATNLKPNN